MNLHSFEHQAMATQFSFTFAGEEEAYVASAAQQCFDRLDALELVLSRFVADSDISRMNRLQAGQSIALELETWEVLKQAIQVQQWTGGTFDVGVAEHMKIFRAAKEGILNEFELHKALQLAQEAKANASLYLDPDHPQFHAVTPGMQFDLGGIGKGYALDQLALLLEELEIETYTLSAGESTVMVKNSHLQPYWEYPIASSQEMKKLRLANIVVSASGTFHQGNHIFDPRTGTNTGVSAFDRIWVASENAAFSDAFSTGLFLMSVEEIENLVELVSEITWVAYSKDGKLFFIAENALNFAPPEH